MNDEVAFHRAMLEAPEDNSLRLIFADWLEERGDPRAELIRLLHALTQSVEVPQRKEKEERLRTLVALGVQPVGPFWTNSIGMKFAWIPAGTFLMGSPEEEEGRGEDETQHTVTLTKGFWLGVHQVTQEQWQAVMSNNPSHFTGEKNLPVENVSWDDCQDFLKCLSEKDGREYHLPTESQWEFACRAGTMTPFFFGDTISTDQANYYGVYDRDKTTPVETFLSNAWGLHDMHGNVWEWCADWLGEYPTGEVVDPQGPSGEERRVLRGGSFDYEPVNVRSASRGRLLQSDRDASTGFRAAMTFSPNNPTLTPPRSPHPG